MLPLCAGHVAEHNAKFDKVARLGWIKEQWEVWWRRLGEQEDRLQETCPDCKLVYAASIKDIA